MKLLIITQKVDINDPVFGFFHRWIEEFAEHYESVIVICLYKGKYDLPKNVKVFSLGKEEEKNKFKYISRFYKYIWKERNNYDSVFVHMNPEYIVLGGLFWRFMNKKIGLWYVHRKVSLKLKIAEKLCNSVFTSIPESFKLKSTKIYYVGHGIDTDQFKCQIIKEKEEKVKILYVGRITKIKNIDTLIKVAKILNKQNYNFLITIIGSPISKMDHDYFFQIKDMIKQYNLDKNIIFLGDIMNREIMGYYCNSDISINLSPTGGIDKSVLESMATRTPVLVSNKAFIHYFGKYSEQLIFRENDPEDLAIKIKNILKSEMKNDIIDYLYKIILEKFEIKKLIEKVVLKLKNA